MLKLQNVSPCILCSSAIVAACGTSSAAGSGTNLLASSSPDLGQGLENYTTGPLPDGSVGYALNYDMPGLASYAVCIGYNSTTNETFGDLSTFHGASGSAMPSESTIKVGAALAILACASLRRTACLQLPLPCSSRLALNLFARQSTAVHFMLLGAGTGRRDVRTTPGIRGCSVLAGDCGWRRACARGCGGFFLAPV